MSVPRTVDMKRARHLLSHGVPRSGHLALVGLCLAGLAIVCAHHAQAQPTPTSLSPPAVQRDALDLRWRAILDLEDASVEMQRAALDHLLATARELGYDELSAHARVVFRDETLAREEGRRRAILPDLEAPWLELASPTIESLLLAAQEALDRGSLVAHAQHALRAEQLTRTHPAYTAVWAEWRHSIAAGVALLSSLLLLGLLLIRHFGRIVVDITMSSAGILTRPLVAIAMGTSIVWGGIATASVVGVAAVMTIWISAHLSLRERLIAVAALAGCVAFASSAGPRPAPERLVPAALDTASVSIGQPCPAACQASLVHDITRGEPRARVALAWTLYVQGDREGLEIASDLLEDDHVARALARLSQIGATAPQAVDDGAASGPSHSEQALDEARFGSLRDDADAAASAAVLRGSLAVRAGLFDEAIEAFQEARGLSQHPPIQGAAKFNSYRAWQLSGDRERSRAALEEALATRDARVDRFAAYRGHQQNLAMMTAPLPSRAAQLTTASSTANGDAPNTWAIIAVASILLGALVARGVRLSRRCTRCGTPSVATVNVRGYNAWLCGGCDALVHDGASLDYNRRRYRERRVEARYRLRLVATFGLAIVYPGAGDILFGRSLRGAVLILVASLAIVTGATAFIANMNTGPLDALRYPPAVALSIALWVIAALASLLSGWSSLRATST